jgi:hypothetical protein
MKVPSGKTRITIRLDNEILDWFRSKVGSSGGRGYQSMINAALRDHIRLGGGDLRGYVRSIVLEEMNNPEAPSSLEGIPPGRLRP